MELVVRMKTIHTGVAVVVRVAGTSVYAQQPFMRARRSHRFHRHLLGAKAPNFFRWELLIC